MPAGYYAAASAMVGRQAAAILLLGVITSGPAAAPAFGRDPDAVALRTSSSAVPTSRELPLPTNLIVPEILRPMVTSMWLKSPTFRRQCARLAEHPDVIVRVELAVAMQHGWARSRLEPHQEGLTAAVQIAMRKPGLYVEHIAHELEHVLEQVDGTDLSRLARQGLDGVVNRGGRYETARAQSVGRTVAHDVLMP
jgi:hypothetical protein